LFVLLGLNCGMLAKDISDLKPEQVDLQAGIITRKRSKTANHPDCPTVTYKLWPTTLDLLKVHAARKGERLLIRDDGQCWVKEEGLGRVDYIAVAYRWVKKQSGADVSPKRPRTLAATLLGQHPQFKFYAQYYLGHSPRSIADKHYVKPNENEFFRALDWLGQQLGMA